MTPQRRRLGGTGLEVSSLCFGTSPLGGVVPLYGYDVPADRAIATIRAALGSPLNFIDTSNNYGWGESERRIGVALAEIGGPPAGLVLATKIDPVGHSLDFSGRRARESVAESSQRLGLDRLQLVYLHDPEKIGFEASMAPGGPVRALVAMRDEGLIEHLGVAGGPIDLLTRFLETGLFEVLISHNRFTLVDQSAAPLMDAAVAADVAFVNGAPYGGGMLVKGPLIQPNYCYQPASPEILTRVTAMERVCREHEVPLAAAALQFSLRDPRVTSTIIGMSRPERISETLQLAQWPIPQPLWDDLAPYLA